MNYPVIILYKGNSLMMVNIIKSLSVCQIKSSGKLIYKRNYIFKYVTNIIIHTFFI